jgi:RNA polymerase sigma-70 factor (ECF subfamily)
MHAQGTAVPVSSRDRSRLPDEADSSTPVMPSNRGRAPALVDDAALVARAKAGDTSAFDPLYRAYSGVMTGYAVKLTQGDRDAAQEIVSEAWLDAITRIGSYERRDNGFVGWLASLVKYQALILFDARRRRSVESPAGAMGEELASEWRRFGRPVWDERDPCDPQAEAEREERLGRLYEAVARLSPLRREVVAQRLNGLSLAETASLVGVTCNAAEKSWSQAVAALRTAVTQPRRLTAAEMTRAEFDAVVARLCGDGRTVLRVGDVVSAFPHRHPNYVTRHLTGVAATGRIPGLRLRHISKGVYDVTRVDDDQVDATGSTGGSRPGGWNSQVRQMLPAAQARVEFDTAVIRLVDDGRPMLRVAEVAAVFPQRSLTYVSRQLTRVAASDRIAGVQLRQTGRGEYAVVREATLAVRHAVQVTTTFQDAA